MPTTGRRTQALRHLETISLSLYEAGAYLALLAGPPVTGYELAKASRIPISKIYETLQRLGAKAAALGSASEPQRYRAAPPEDSIAGIRGQTDRSLAALATSLRLSEPRRRSASSGGCRMPGPSSGNWTNSSPRPPRWSFSRSGRPRRPIWWTASPGPGGGACSCESPPSARARCVARGSMTCSRVAGAPRRASERG
jgi:hypothetical protein